MASKEDTSTTATDRPGVRPDGPHNASGRTHKSVRSRTNTLAEAGKQETDAKQAHLDATAKAHAARAQLEANSELARVVLDNERQIRDGNIPDPDAPIATAPAPKAPEKRAKITSLSAAEKQGWVKAIDDPRGPDAGKSSRSWDDYRGVHYEKQMNGSAVRAGGLTEEEAVREMEAAEARSEANYGAGGVGVYTS